MGKNVVRVLKALTISYGVTAILLGVITYVAYSLEWSMENMKYIVWITYGLASFIGGLLLGKIQGKRRLIWGAILGITYVLGIGILTVALQGFGGITVQKMSVCCVECIFLSTLGGILS